ncbi:MAG: glycosyltransferase family 9 protein [Planctomycetota bacterium]|nr:MAG: glycosyltransferase family 9 protein [Planctomycetota bacterium]
MNLSATAASRGLEPERILVVRTRFVGDTVLAIPFLRNLRRRHPRAQIDVLVEQAPGAVLADCPYKDELLVLPDAAVRGVPIPAALSTLFANARWLRNRHYSRAYILKRSLSAILLVRLAGIPHRVGFASQGGGLLLSRAARIGGHRHEVEVFLDLLRVDGIPVDDGRNENWVAPDVATKVDRRLGGLPPDRTRVFIAPRSTAREKEWPVERMARVVSWLVNERNCEVVFCGAPRDMAMHQEIATRAGTRAARHAHDMTSEFNLRETGGLLARMHLAVGVDTGLLHVAASHCVPVVSLVGPTDPNRWCPWGTFSEVIRAPRLQRPWALRLRQALFPLRGSDLHWPIGTAAMNDIGVEQVEAAIDRLLAGRQAVLPSRQAAA